MLMNSMRSRFFSRGVTLVELIVSIVVISVALAGVLIVIVRGISGSADPMIWHQSVAIAEAYLEEILSKNFTPDGVEPTRGAYDDVMDYNNLTEPPHDQNGSPIPVLAGYTVKVQVTAPSSAWNGVAVSNVWVVQVTVKPPGGNGGDVVISGYRTNY